MCPIVPTFKCGLLRSNFSFAISLHPLKRCGHWPRIFIAILAFRDYRRPFQKLERGTGFEPATICLEGRDSTTELPPLILPCQTQDLSRGFLEARPTNSSTATIESSGAWDRD